MYKINCEHQEGTLKTGAWIEKRVRIGAPRQFEHLDVKTRGRTSKDLKRKFDPAAYEKLVGYAFPENEERFQKERV